MSHFPSMQQQFSSNNRLYLKKKNLDKFANFLACIPHFVGRPNMLARTQ